MKKLSLFALLSAVLAVVLAACGGEEAAPAAQIIQVPKEIIVEKQIIKEVPVVQVVEKEVVRIVEVPGKTVVVEKQVEVVRTVEVPVERIVEVVRVVESRSCPSSVRRPSWPSSYWLGSSLLSPSG